MEYRVDGFHDLMVWQKAHEIFIQIVKDIEKFPKTKAAYILSDQLIRAIGGISSGISEGYGAGQGKEFPYRLMVSRKECSEAADWLLKAQDLSYIPPDRLKYYIQNLDEIRKMLNSLAGKLRERNTRK
jgi:four helix bundle protein